MKNKIVFLIFVFLFLTSIVFAGDNVDVTGFISEVKEYSSEFFPEFSDENWLENILKR